MRRPAEEEGPETGLMGTVARVTYRSDDGRYSVLRIEPDRGYADPDNPWGGLLTAVGEAPEAAEGLRVRLHGRWTRHKSHGRQFAFASFEVLTPASADGLVRYLSSPVFEGVGEVLAKRIVEALGTGALERIRDDPTCLARVKGLRTSVARQLAATVTAAIGSHRLHSFLLGLGLGGAQAARVARELGPQAEALLREDPYRLTRVRGFGFWSADRVAHALGFEDERPERLRAALLFALGTASREGHSLLPRERLVDTARELLRGDLAPELLDAELEPLERAGEVVLERVSDESAGAGAERTLVYLPVFHACERGLARNLLALIERGAARPLADAAALRRAEERTGLDLHPMQRDAVLGLLRSPVGLLTGGPGVGKTTIVRLVVELAEAAGASVRLASPTGRAAKRLSEATGRDASTIHRLLGWEPSESRFAHNDRQPLVADLVVVDELSMLDVVLAYHLSKAIQPPTRLVLVGDPDQLPSVQAGNVLADLLASGRVPVWRLIEIFRQERGSLIVRNAHKILNGEMPELPERDEPGADFFFFPADDDRSTAERLVEVVCERVPRRFHLDWADDVQVLAPMYKGECGVDALNGRLREALGQAGRQLELGGAVWREGDRVIHTRNDYDKQVFNGDMGRIARVNPDKSGLFVRYPEQEVFYTPDELGDLQPAFAITVHRSQGGEFPCVVMPLVPAHFVMLQRHLLYTAVTRARKLVVIVGSRRALQMAVDNGEQGKRESGLAALLREAGGRSDG